MKFSHVALNCGDVRATADFYVKYLGFSLARVIDLGDGRQLIFIRRGDVLLELFPTGGDAPAFEKDGPTARGTLRHLAFQVDSVDDVLATFGTAAPVTLGPLSFDDFIPGWRTAWVRDPDGNIVEISQGFVDDPNLSTLTFTGGTA